MLSESPVGEPRREVAFTDVPDRLRYTSGEISSPLPDWARYLMRLGGSVGARPEEAGSIMAVASVPVRAFAAVFASMGVIVGRLVDPGRGLSVEEHFRRISSKELGTAVTVTRGMRRFMGVFQGTGDRDGTSYLRVQISGKGGGNETLGIPLGDSHRVQLQIEPYELTDRKRSTSAPAPTQFLVACLGEHSATRLVERARTDCVLRGHYSLLGPELRDQGFAAETGETGSPSQDSTAQTHRR